MKSTLNVEKNRKKINCFIISLFLLIGCTTTTQSSFQEYGKLPSYDYVAKGWDFVSAQDYESAIKTADECLELYSDKAKEINAGCALQDTAGFTGKCGYLNDVGQCVYIKAQSYFEMNEFAQVQNVCAELKEHYNHSIVFDPRGLPWKPVDACASLLEKIQEHDNHSNNLADTLL